jgi:hypothetical protein
VKTPLGFRSLTDGASRRCCDAQNRAPNPSTGSLRRQGHAFRLNLPYLVHLLEENAAQPWRAEDGVFSARAATVLHCLAAPSAIAQGMHEGGGQRREADECRIVFLIAMRLFGACQS